MRTKKRLTVLLVILAMVVALFTGCSSGGTKKGKVEGGSQGSGQEAEVKAGTGRFFENEVSLPKGISRIRSFRKLADGSLGAVGEDDKKDKGYYLLQSKNLGKKWQKTKITGMGKGYKPCAAISPDGTAVIFGYPKDGKITAYLIDEKGKATVFSPALPEKSMENPVRQAAYDADGKLIVRDFEENLFLVDADGACKKLFDTKGEGIHYFGIAGGLLIAVYDEGVFLYDTKKQEVLEEEETLDELVKKDLSLVSADTDSGQPMVFSEGTQESDILFANKDGIFHFARGGSVVEELMDSSFASFGTGNMVFQDMAVIDNENIFIAGTNSELYHYSYDEKAASVPEQELTVYALDESSYLRKAVALFQKENPDIHVNLEFGLSGKDGVTLEDALSVLNTNLLAGKGPDVLILDGMPADSYIEKGILADITDIVESVEKEEGIFSNIIEGSKKDGKIYAMPARFLFSIVEGDKEALKAGGSLDNLAKKAEELKKQDSSSNVIPGNKGTRTLLRDLYYADSAAWQKEDGSIDKDRLAQFLENAKRLYDVDKADKEEDFRDKSIGDGTFSGVKTGTNDSAALVNKSCKFSFGSITSFLEFQGMCSTWKQTKADYCLMNGDTIKSYIPYLSAGVVAKENTETAKLFVKSLLGKKAEASDINESTGFPVNRAAFDAFSKEKMDDPRVKEGMSVGFGDEDGMYGYEYRNLTQEEVDRLTEIVESLTEPSMTNRVIQEIVLEQGDKYLLGEQELESTVEAVLQKVNLYLAE